MTRTTLVIAIGCAFLATNLCGIAAAQESEEFEGGTFEYGGEVLEVTAEELEAHARWLRGLGRDGDFAALVESAWARAVRTRSASLAGIEVDDDAFRAWMEKQHAGVRHEWLVDGRVDPDRFRQFLARRGYEDDLEAYEAQCRLEYAGERFVALEFPERTTTEEQVREHFDRSNAVYVLSALTFAPETLDDPLVPDPEDERFRQLFRDWYASLPDARKIIYDDVERPAVACEAIYVLFGKHTIASFKERFETPLPGLGKSLAELTADIEPKPFDRAKIYQRWVAFRRIHYSNVAQAVPDGASDQESFEIVEEHLVREWKTIRHLGRLHRRLAERERSGEILDLEKVAAEVGLPHRRYPLSSMRVLVNDVDHDAELRGDHPYSMRRTPPGKLYSYLDNSDSASNDYYTDGVVDQPGYHASIWRVIAVEEMRVRPADEVMDRAWPDFARSLEWKDVDLRFERFAERYLAMLKQSVDEANASLSEPGSVAEARERSRALSRRARRETFDRAVADAKGIGRVLGPFYFRPGQPRTRNPIQDGPLGQRLDNFLELDWDRITGGVGTVPEKGDVFPDAGNEARRLHVIVRVDDVITPPESRWEDDSAARTRARKDLESAWARRRLRQIRLTYAWPNLAQKFSIKSEQLDRVMLRK